jgi:hypothetical protein
MKTKKIKARKMILLHSKSGAYDDYTLQLNATEAALAKMADETCGRSVIISPVLVLPATPEAYDAIKAQMLSATLKYNQAPGIGKTREESCDKALRSIGITRPRSTQPKKRT